jgi:hypothetical protein
MWMRLPLLVKLCIPDPRDQHLAEQFRGNPFGQSASDRIGEVPEIGEHSQDPF